MLSLMFDKVGFSLVHYKSCGMGIGIPLSLNSQAYCRWNSLCAMIFELQDMSLAPSLKNILRCYKQSYLSKLRSDIFEYLQS